MGRPKKPDKKLPYGTKLRPDQIEWLRAQDNAAAELEKALDERMRSTRLRPPTVAPDYGWGRRTAASR